MITERGPVGSFLFLNLCLLNDQTVENATGVGAPPWTSFRESGYLLFKKCYFTWELAKKKEDL